MKILILFIIFPVLGLSREPLRALSEFTAQFDKSAEEIEISNIGYVGIRCAALYTCVSVYFDEAAVTDVDKKFAESIAEKAKIFSSVGVAAALRSKSSQEFILKQSEALMKHYADEMMENKKLNNSTMTVGIRNDLTEAKRIFPLFAEMAKQFDGKK